MHDATRPSHPPSARRLRTPRATTLLVLAMGLLLSVPVAARAQGAAASKEHQIKAAFLYNFARYVDWPADRFGDENSPLVVAVLGKHPIEQELSSLAKERSAKGRPVEVRLVTSPEEIASAHILFVPTGEEARLPPSLRDTAGVLTVGESAEFARRGGVITFILVADKIRFEINQGSGERAGLKLSGQLLKLATVLRKDP